MKQIEAPEKEVVGDKIVSSTDTAKSMVFYGDYRCGECKHLHDELASLVDEEDLPVRYVFRYLPASGASGDIQLPIAAAAAERQDKFWDMHDALFASDDSEDAIAQAAQTAGLRLERFREDCKDPALIRQVEQGIEEARSHQVDRIPTLLIGGREYTETWDAESIKKALFPPVAYRLSEAAKRFADWAAASGVVLIIFAVAALILRNSPLGEWYEHIWETRIGFMIAGFSLDMNLHYFVNDFLMTAFFLVVGLELKRELLEGELSQLRKAAFPMAAALGGMLVPAAIYAAATWGTESFKGWGIPMATDIAFTLGVLGLLRSRIAVSMILFATALAVVDDLGAILVLALAYSEGISWLAIFTATGLFLVLVGFNRIRVFALWPYLLVGTCLWIACYYSGLHATLSGVLLAATIPRRSKAALNPLLAQVAAGVKQARGQLIADSSSLKDPGPNENGFQRDQQREKEERERLVQRLEVIERRLNPPAERLERNLQPWSSYLVLPLFALANAGVLISPQETSILSASSLGILGGLIVGKPLGILLAAWISHSIGIGQKPSDAEWSDITGVGILCGIGFTMSIFISTQAFQSSSDLANAKLAVIIASFVAAIVGTIWFYFKGQRN